MHETKQTYHTAAEATYTDASASTNAISLVQALAQARSNCQQILALQPHWHLPDEAAGVQTMLQVADSLGWPRLGWKIAATNPLLQQKLRTEGPVFGATFQRFLRHSPTQVMHQQLLDPVIECEFAFTLGRELPVQEADYSFDDLAAAIGSVHTCVEIAECRFAHLALPPVPYIMADGFASGWYVLGEPVPDWQQAFLRGVRVQLLRNGEAHSQGSSMDVMGHPLQPLVWLANRLRRLGQPLRAGDMVSTGSCNILCRARAGDRFEAVYEGLGKIELHTP